MSFKRPLNRQCWLLSALAALALFAASEARGQGTIVYGRFPITSPLIPDTPFYPYDSQGYRLLSWEPLPGITYPFPLDQDGIPIYTFYSGTDFSIHGNSTAAILSGRLGSPPFFSALVIPLPAGYLIGADPGDYEWAQERSVFTAARSSGIEGDPLLTVGFFTGLDSAYAGLRFEIDGQTHYGWVRVGAPGTGLNGGWLYDYAYETRPDTPIFAGAVPEPSTWALLALGASVIVAVHRRRKS